MKSMFEWISCKAETKKKSTKYHGKLFDHSEQNMAGVIFTSVAYFLMIIIVIITAVRRPPVEKDVLVVHVDLPLSFLYSSSCIDWKRLAPILVMASFRSLCNSETLRHSGYC